MWSDVEIVCCIIIYTGSVILLENLRFHIAEEGKGKDSEGKKVRRLRSELGLLLLSRRLRLVSKT